MTPNAPGFIGRARERKRLDDLIQQVRSGASATLVVLGEPGIGKTALLQYCEDQAQGCRVARVAGVESELELPLAGVHQLCVPLLTLLPQLPDPQRQALEIAFGLSPGSPPDRFLVGLAVLGLLSEASANEPLVCLIDDAQWLDEASVQVLVFVARRLWAESVLMVFAAREVEGARLLRDLPTLAITGLSESDARLLLAARVSGPIDTRVRDRVLAETRGNPLALLELPSRVSPAEMAAGFGVPEATTVSSLVEERYIQRIEALPEATRHLLVLAAADPTGDATLLWRAAQTLGIEPDAAVVTDAEDLLEIDARVHFRHPLVRSASYACGSGRERAAAHTALAAATDETRDPDRRAWHLALAATGPDEEIASHLERVADRAQARAGVAAAAEILRRAFELTPDAEQRARRALAAGRTHLHAGTYEAARTLAAQATALAVDDLQRASAEHLLGQVEAAATPGGEAPLRLLEAARRLEHLDPLLARETYLQAWWAAVLAGRYAVPGGALLEVSEAARQAPDVADPRLCDLLLDGLATLITEDRTAAEPPLREAIDRFRAGQVSDEDWFQWGRSATTAAFALWDFDSWSELSARHVALTRASGALGSLVLSLSLHSFGETYRGRFDAAAAMVAEQNAAMEATGARMTSYGAQLLDAYRGRSLTMPSPGEVSDVERPMDVDGYALQVAGYANAVLNNGLGRYADAISAAEQVAVYEFAFLTPLALSELIEAAVKAEDAGRASDATRRLSAMAISGSPWAAGIMARANALLSVGEDAEGLYNESLRLLGQISLLPELARSHLLFGEWLRRENRRLDARHHLRIAHESFAAMGADGFSDRARRELVATGEKVRKRVIETRGDLTARELHIARLARDGHTNPEIGAELFLSVRTVEWHLRRVFNKLGINSRRELKDALPGPPE